MLLEEALKKFCPTIKDLCVGDQCIAWKKTKLNQDNTGINDDLIDEISDFVFKGDRIGAIKLLRSSLGVTLSAAKDAIEDQSYRGLIMRDWRYNNYSNKDLPRGFCHVYQNTLEQGESSYDSY